MNKHDPFLPVGTEAQIEYLDGDYRIIKQGAYVRCFVTGAPVPLDDLRYWSAERQEAYSGPEAVLQRINQLKQA